MEIQQSLAIIDQALNRGNGNLTFYESREVANAFDSLISFINESQQSKSVPPTGPKKPPKGE